MLKNYRNMGDIDRITRTLFGCVLIYVGAGQVVEFSNMLLRTAIVLFGLTNIISAVFSICPAYVMANVSTRRARNADGESNVSEDNRELARTRFQLLTMLTVPSLLVVLVFSWSMFQLGARYALSEDTRAGEAATRMAAAYLRSGEQAWTATESTPHKAYRHLLDDTVFLVVHDNAGSIINKGVEKRAADAEVEFELLNDLDPTKMDFNASSSGAFKSSSQMLLWTTLPFPEQKAWITAAVYPNKYNKLLSSLVGTQVIVFAAVVMWLVIWGAMYIARKFTQRVAENAGEMRERSLHDELTGLPNRTGLDARLAEALETRGTDSITDIALLMVDLNDFRNISDTLGYRLGDTLIKDISERLVSVVGKSGEVCRWSGDVFSIIYYIKNDLSQVGQLVNQLHDCVEQPVDLNIVQISVNFRIGISLFPENTADHHELIRFADVALGRAKRDQVGFTFYEPDRDAHSVRKLALLSGLRTAIDKDLLRVVYQPKIDIATNRLVGVEALARWTHDTYGEVPPSEFVALAEQSGLINKLTHWVLRETECQCTAWRMQGLDIPIAVNLSPMNLHDPTLPGLLNDLVSHGGFADGFLELELTENAVMQDPGFALKTMSFIFSLGVPIAVDDFGTGLSSFSYLRKFPISSLKIDRSFVMEMSKNDRDSVLVNSIVELGHNLGCTVTAEGVEDAEALELLKSIGCDNAQGYYVSEPVSAVELVKWLQASTWVQPNRAA